METLNNINSMEVNMSISYDNIYSSFEEYLKYTDISDWELKSNYDPKYDRRKKIINKLLNENLVK